MDNIVYLEIFEYNEAYGGDKLTHCLRLRYMEERRLITRHQPQPPLRISLLYDWWI